MACSHIDGIREEGVEGVPTVVVARGSEADPVVAVVVVILN